MVNLSNNIRKHQHEEINIKGRKGKCSATLWNISAWRLHLSCNFTWWSPTVATENNFTHTHTHANTTSYTNKYFLSNQHHHWITLPKNSADWILTKSQPTCKCCYKGTYCQQPYDNQQDAPVTKYFWTSACASKQVNYRCTVTRWESTHTEPQKQMLFAWYKVS